MDTKKLRQKILDLAIHGKLVPQDPSDEPASVLLERIKTEKERLIKEGKIKKNKKSTKASDTPHYENVPFEIPDNWEWCKLGDIVDFQGGYAYKSNTYVNQSDWQVIRIGNVKNDNLVLDTQPVFVEEVIGRETKKYLLQKDDILFTMTGTKGKRDYFYSVKVPSVQNKLLLNQRVGCLRRFSSEVNIDFLCFALKGEYVLDAIFSTETGNVSQGNIGSENTLNLNIAIPPLAEQRRIVSEIERWFSLIDIIENGKQDLQTSIKQARNKILDLAIHGKLVPQDPNDEPAIELLKRINPSFTPCDNGHRRKLPQGWAYCQLKITMGQSPKGDSLNNKKGIEFHQGKICFSDKFLLESGIFTNEPTKIAEPNSILLCVRAPVGVVNITKNQICIGRGLCALTPFEGNVDFYFYLLQTLQDSFDNQSTGTTFKAISGEIIRNENIILPPLAEQQRIVQKIEESFHVLDNIQNALEV